MHQFCINVSVVRLLAKSLKDLAADCLTLEFVEFAPGYGKCALFFSLYRIEGLVQ